MNYIKVHKIDLFVFLCLFTLVSLFSVSFPLMPSHDFYNYHWYNAFAFLNDRHDIDFFASNIRTYFYPLLDIISYVLISKFNNYPLFLNIIFSLDTTILMFLLYKIIDFIFSNHKKMYVLIISFLSILYVFTSPTLLLVQSFDCVDILFSIPILFAFYFFLKYILNSNKSLILKSFICGALLGISFSLKLVSISYVVLFLFLFLFYSKKFHSPFKMCFNYILGVLFVFLLVDGFWLFFLHTKFGNPFFPYFNHIFNSPYADSINLRSVDYAHIKPRNLLEYVFYCFYPIGKNVYGLDNEAWDFRIALNYFVLCFFVVVLLFSSKIKSNLNSFIKIEYFTSLFFFILIPFLINTHLFGTYRYILSSILFLGVILFILLFLIFSKLNTKLKYFVSCLFFISIFNISLKYSYLGHLPFFIPPQISKISSSLFYKVEPNIVFSPNSAVLFLNSATSFVANNSKNVNYYGYYLPLEYVEKLKLRTRYFDNQHIYSSYLKNFVQELIESDKKLYVVCNLEENSDIFIDSLNSYNQKLEHKRSLKNCTLIKPYYLSKMANFYNVQICEYNH